MRKLLFLAIFLFFSISISYADTKTTSTSYTSTSLVKNCLSITSHSVVHNWVPTTNQVPANKSWTLSCTNHTYYISWNYYTSEKYIWITTSLSFPWFRGNIITCNSWDRATGNYESRSEVKSCNWFSCSYYWYVKLECSTYDDIPPTISDITWNWLDLNNTYFSANNSKNFSISVDSSWGSSIVSIKWEFEKNNVSNNTKDSLSSINSSLIVDRDVSNIDINKWINNYRDYTFNITEVKDEAWNLMTSLPIYTYHVYAWNADSTNSLVTWTTNFDDQIADWSEKTLTVQLKDIYDNKVTPVYKEDWITLVRSLNITAYYDNDLYLDQLASSWPPWVDLTWFDSTTYWNSTIWTNKTKSTVINDKNNNDWIYYIKFKVYSPTYKWWVLDWRQHAKWNFSIYKIISYSSDTKTDSQNVLSSNLDFQFKPIYYTTLTWEIATDWFVEWTTQTWSINIYKNVSSTNHTIDWLYFVQSWSTKDYFTWTWKINTWYHAFSTTSIWEKFLSSFNTTTSYILESLFTLVDNWWFIDDIKDIRLNEYIRYTIWWKTVTYLAWILNSNNNQSFETLKIFWISNIDADKQKDLTENQEATDIQNLAWEIVKAWLKMDIRKAAINTIKFVNTEDETLSITDLTWNTWNDSSNWWKVLWDILYYDDLAWANVELWSINTTEFITWKKTIIVIWWNLYIKSNIINSSTSDILWIIVLKDENGNWWKVYIDTSVLEVDAIIYADKSVISYNESYDNGNPNSIIKYEVDWNIDNQIMQNQLYILWSIFSENTMWGSRIDPPVCPFYTKSIIWFVCNSIEAQKYDFNYLRAWYNNKYDNSYADYPVIINYNSTVQSTPPPLFDK